MIDLEKIRAYTGGDDAFILMLFDKFLSHLDTDLEALQKETAAQNWVGVSAKAHAMLSSARIFYLQEIIALSEKVETACHSGNTSETAQDIDKLVELYKKAKAEIQEQKKILA